jgi:hypothetical protein
MHKKRRYFINSSSSSLAPQPSLGLDFLRNLLPLKMAEFLGGFSTFFYRVRLLAPRPTPTPEDQAFVFVSPRGRVAQLYPQALGTHFSRLLRHAWVTVGLFLFPGHHTGNFITSFSQNVWWNQPCTTYAFIPLPQSLLFSWLHISSLWYL